MQLSINPTYFCNFSCSHCYLGTANLQDKLKLDLSKLKLILEDISNHTEITHVDLYGGEIGLLPQEYLKELESTIEPFYQGVINIITNFSNIHPFFSQDNVEITVSYDYIYREHHQKVLSNIVKFEYPIHIIVLAIDDIINNADKDIPIMHEMFSTLGNVRTVEIKPYSGNQYNQQSSTYLDYEEYIEKWLRLKGDYELVNRNKIEDCLEGISSSYSDDHIYITPKGNISILDFDDDNNNELFLEVDNFQDYLSWCKKEKEKVINNNICNSCEFLGHCLSEHLKNVKSLENSCNGFINLLSNYKGNFNEYDKSQKRFRSQ